MQYNAAKFKNRELGIWEIWEFFYLLPNNQTQNKQPPKTTSCHLTSKLA